MQIALITGANGFCAAHLARRLQSDGIRVVGLDIHPAGSATQHLDEYLQVDIRDFEGLSRAVRAIRPDAVFHLAGVGGGDFQRIFETNVLGTVNLLESVRLAGGHARVLLVGSASEYGLIRLEELPATEETPCRPITTYGLSKHFATLAGQSYCRRCGLKVVIARVFNLVGAGIPDSLVVGALLERARVALRGPAPPIVKIGNLRSQRDFIPVTDAVDVFVRMVRGNFWGEVFNVCSGRVWTIDEIADKLLAHSTRRIELKVDPDLVCSSEVDIIFGSNEKARRCLGFEAGTSLETALKTAWDHHIGERCE